MKISGVLILSFLSILSLQAENAYGAVLEVPDEYLGSPRESIVEGGILREKRQLNVTGSGSEKKGNIKLEGKTNLFDNGKTKIDGKAFYEHQYARGMPSQRGAGLEAEVTRNIWKGRNGESLELFGNAGKQWHSGPRPNNHNFGAGLRYRF